jgi:hypothetical protein
VDTRSGVLFSNLLPAISYGFFTVEDRGNAHLLPRTERWRGTNNPFYVLIDAVSFGRRR